MRLDPIRFGSLSGDCALGNEHRHFGDWFPDHKALLLRINFPLKPQVEAHWQMPVRLPWEDIDAGALDMKCAQLKPISNQVPTINAKLLKKKKKKRF